MIRETKCLDVPHLRFPEFSGEWKKCKLGDLCNVLMCKRILVSQTNTEDGVPFYKIGTIGSTPDAYISKELFDDYKVKYNYPRKGEVMITCAGTVGKCVVYDGEDAYFQDSNIVWIDNPTQYISNGFLFHLLSKVDWRKLNSTTIIRIYNDDLRNLKMSYPRKEEQQKISHLLSLLDERIATQNKIIEKLQSLIKGLIDDIITLKCGQLVAFETLYSKAGEGGTPTTSNTEFYDNGSIPFIKIDDLSNKYLSANKDYITELGLKKSSAWLIPTHSIIYSNGATIGAISINKYPVCTKQGILGIVPNTNIDVEFLYYFMQSSYFQKEVERVVTEGTMKTAYLKDINHIKCPIPDLDRQKEISHLLSVLSLKEDVERQLLQKYQIQKQYLLRKMFI
ncbi:restriction endonuclease subunit S [Bacteroides ovatus]|uniref:Restriction endonuclease subunit S n=2 Tax=Bacteroidaceae TaxID=815 RepID=A0A5N4EQP9_BACOV|nr:restriction endonuclease subunit S [Bacteroides ovatus]KAB6648595.1 restriction endonuclease subunit S [Phocaeicola vulgatus]KAA4575319.1 restriction endonuclease subunit S [Bacteroides ovatus]KAA4576437.1 restriction endonuclease subunit S [Bacteroides ovatus]KAA4590098.1 restriction endonuclease subunit S [Bacteroides ovatus]